ncbi:unnamed protein product [Cochlearia groenlandica]
MDTYQPLLQDLPSLSELESRMQLMQVSSLDQNQTVQTQTQRAEYLNQSHPLLLTLCQDLYDAYAALLNRFYHYKSQQNTSESITDISSEADSILSFQQQQQTQTHNKHNIEELISQLEKSNLEKDLAENKVRIKERKLREATKTIDLLKKLVTLLDMEKELSVEETVTLGYKLTSLLEQNRELASESLFMKREAVKLARCVLKMRDEYFQRVCLLENQIYDAMHSPRDVVTTSSPSCFGFENKKSKKRKISETRSEGGEKKRQSKWLKRFNTINPFTKC